MNLAETEVWGEEGNIPEEEEHYSDRQHFEAKALIRHENSVWARETAATHFQDKTPLPLSYLCFRKLTNQPFLQEMITSKIYEDIERRYREKKTQPLPDHFLRTLGQRALAAAYKTLENSGFCQKSESGTMPEFIGVFTLKIQNEECFNRRKEVPKFENIPLQDYGHFITSHPHLSTQVWIDDDEGGREEESKGGPALLSVFFTPDIHRGSTQVWWFGSQTEAALRINIHCFFIPTANQIAACLKMALKHGPMGKAFCSRIEKTPFEISFERTYFLLTSDRAWGIRERFYNPEYQYSIWNEREEELDQLVAESWKHEERTRAPESLPRIRRLARELFKEAFKKREKIEGAIIYQAPSLTGITMRFGFRILTNYYKNLLFRPLFFDWNIPLYTTTHYKTEREALLRVWKIPYPFLPKFPVF